MDSRQLLIFLSQARTISEVAHHLNVPVGTAQRLILEAVESGRVVMRTRPVKAGLPTTAPHQTGSVKTSSLSASETKADRPVPFNFMGGNRSRTNLDEYSAVAFKLRAGQPALVRRSARPLSASEILGEKSSRTGRKALSSSSLVGLLEMLENGPKPLMDLRASFGVSRESLIRLQNRGIISSAWGSRGVGVLYKITRKGLSELARVRAASKLGSMSKKPLISMRTRISH